MLRKEKKISFCYDDSSTLDCVSAYKYRQNVHVLWESIFFGRVATYYENLTVKYLDDVTLYY